jgi:hypothetical protein
MHHYQYMGYPITYQQKIAVPLHFIHSGMILHIQFFSPTSPKLNLLCKPSIHPAAGSNHEFTQYLTIQNNQKTGPISAYRFSLRMESSMFHLTNGI